MALITIELRNLLKTNFELFDFDYSFDDKQFAKDIERAVVDYFYFHEIGTATPDRFKHAFRSTYQRIMPYYNKLHNTSLLEYNPLLTVKMTEALEQLSKTTAQSEQEQTSTTKNKATGSSNQSGTSSDNTTNDSTTDHTNQSTSESKNSKSDYPQHVSGADYESESTKGTTTDNTTGKDTTAQTTSSSGKTSQTGSNTSQTDGSGSSTSSGNQQGKTENSYEKTIEGMTGRTYQELVQLERENLIRITSMIIEELKPLFILIY